MINKFPTRPPPGWAPLNILGVETFTKSFADWASTGENRRQFRFPRVYSLRLRTNCKLMTLAKLAAAARTMRYLRILKIHCRPRALGLQLINHFVYYTTQLKRKEGRPTEKKELLHSCLSICS